MIGAIRRRFNAAHYVMVVGSGESAVRIGRALEQSSDYGIRLVGFFDHEAGAIAISKDYEVHPL